MHDTSASRAPPSIEEELRRDFERTILKLQKVNPSSPEAMDLAVDAAIWIIRENRQDPTRERRTVVIEHLIELRRALKLASQGDAHPALEQKKKPRNKRRVRSVAQLDFERSLVEASDAVMSL